MTIDSDTSVHQPMSVLALWMGLLLAPLAFILGLVALYPLSAPGCVRRHELVLHGVHAFTVIVGLIGWAIAWSTERITRHGSTAAAIGPGVRLLAQVAAGLTPLFVLAMLVQWAAEFVYNGCW